MLMRGNTKIAEVYKGLILIGRIYQGNTKVYDVNPYVKGTELMNSTPATYEVNLPKGVYKLALGGAKGEDTVGVAGGMVWVAFGGGGGFVEVLFYNPHRQTLKITAPSNGGATAELNGQIILTAGAGTQNVSGGAGGKNTIENNFEVIEIIKNIAGQNGMVQPAGAGSISSVSSYGNWGSSANSSGGARLEYVRYVK